MLKIASNNQPNINLFVFTADYWDRNDGIVIAKCLVNKFAWAVRDFWRHRKQGAKKKAVENAEKDNEPAIHEVIGRIGYCNYENAIGKKGHHIEVGDWKFLRKKKTKFQFLKLL